MCSNCGSENRAGRKFCAECGNPLAVTCTSCGAANEPGERFLRRVWFGTGVRCCLAIRAAAAPAQPAAGPTVARGVAGVLPCHRMTSFVDVVQPAGPRRGRGGALNWSDAIHRCNQS